MAKKAANVIVKSRQCGNSADRMIRRFIKKTKKEKIIEECRERRYHKKPSEAKKEKQKRAKRRRQREKQKQLREQERRNRRKR